MCLAIPGKVNSIFEHADFRSKFAEVQFGSISKDVCLDMLPDTQVGDYVLVHVGVAISKVDEEEAARVFKYLDEVGELDDLITKE